MPCTPPPRADVAPSVYRRPLPEGLIAFASDEGRTLFREALLAGDMEGFFALAEQFHTQADPAFCALGTLVVVLNALGVDPGRLWKGPWRWYSEELLDCCAPLDRVRQRGLTLDEVACLARCNGADVHVERPTDDLSALRDAVREAARTAFGSVVIASYSRGALGQTGSGHYSPIGGFHAPRDLVLVLDVARFKYPPHWVPLARLHQAMRDLDPETHSPRGWIVMRRRSAPAALLYCVASPEGAESVLASLFERIPSRIEAAAPATAADALRAFGAALTDLAPPFEVRSAIAPEHTLAAQRLHDALHATEVWKALQSDPAAVMALAAPDSLWDKAPAAVRTEVLQHLHAARAIPLLAPEISQVREQLDALHTVALQRA